MRTPCTCMGCGLGSDRRSGYLVNGRRGVPRPSAQLGTSQWGSVVRRRVLAIVAVLACVLVGAWWLWPRTAQTAPSAAVAATPPTADESPLKSGRAWGDAPWRAKREAPGS